MLWGKVPNKGIRHEISHGVLHPLHLAVLATLPVVCVVVSVREKRECFDMDGNGAKEFLNPGTNHSWATAPCAVCEG